MCKCASSRDSEVTICYNVLTPCGLCPPNAEGQAQFRQACGCVHCKNVAMRPFYASMTTVFGFPHSCTDEGWENLPLCGPGKCMPCPPGHHCPDKRVALPCSPGTYQPRAGQTACIECRVTMRDTYLRQGMSIEAACDPVTGLNASMVMPCDECTSTAETAKRCVPETKCALCTSFRRDYGLFAAPDLQRQPPTKCRPCLQCSGRQYARPGAGDQYCVTDQSTDRCAERYNADTSHAYGYDEEGDGLRIDGEVEVLGAMPWKAGYRRMESYVRYRPGANFPGLLPHYVPCAQVSYAYPYAPLDPALLNARDWAFDCDPTTTRMCAEGAYAVLVGMRSGAPILAECRPCGANAHGGGNLSTHCTCSAGYASLSEIIEAVHESPLFVDDHNDEERACFNCLTDVAWSHADINGGEIIQEALACASGGSPAVRCMGPTEYVDPIHHVCASCSAPCTGGMSVSASVPRSIPNVARTACVTCNAGEFIAQKGQHTLVCEQCEAGYFQNVQGQCVCRRKRATCPPGSHVEQSLASALDATQDYVCSPCKTKCAEGEITIVAPHESSTTYNTCDGSGGDDYYFACYDGTVSDTGPLLLEGQRLAYPSTHGVSLETRAHVELCDATLLPPEARFVRHSVPSAGVQCYFACLHGVNLGVAVQWNHAVDVYVRAHRVDLIPFLPSTGAQPAPQLTIRQFNVPAGVWLYDSGNDVPMHDPKKSWAATANVRGQAVSSAIDNTFLFVDSAVPIPSNICLSAAQAYTWACPTGVPPSTSAGSEVTCALDARGGLYALDSGQFVTQTQQCLSTSRDLSTFRAACGTPCLDTRLRWAQLALLAEPPSSPWNARFLWLTYFLQPSVWRDSYGAFNPYRAPSTLHQTNNGSAVSDLCATTCVASLFDGASSAAAVTGTFRYSTNDHPIGEAPPLVASLPTGGITACVPCIFGNTICAQLFTPRRFFLASVCNSNSNGARELTVADVCSRCATATSVGGTLIDRMDDAYELWLKARIGLPAPNDWARVTCRYRCPAGYTSNNVGPDQYNEHPCVPCQTPVQTCSSVMLDLAKVPAFVSADVCAASIAGNYAPVVATCDACASALQVGVGFVFAMAKGASNPVIGKTQCAALCNPAQFHSFDADTKELLSDPVPFRQLTCRACADTSGLSCQGKCGAGYYHGTAQAGSDTDCFPCTTAPCPSAQMYREQCLAGAAEADARCLPCPVEALRNAIDGAGDAGGRALRMWVDYTPGAYVVVPVASSPHPTQCALACVNNHAWVNLTSGLSPFARNGIVTLTHELACLPCTTLDASTPLYSIWNAMNTTPADGAYPARSPSRAVASMAGLPGACYPCPGNGIRDVIATSTSMCELRPGYTMSAQGVPTYVEVTTTVAAFNVTTTGMTMGSAYSVLAQPQIRYPPDMDVLGRRRRRMRRVLLFAQTPNETAGPIDLSVSVAAEGSQPVVTRMQRIIPTMRAPVFVGQGEHLACCDTETSASASACRALRGLAYYYYQHHGMPTCARGGTAAARRRLLQQPDAGGGDAAFLLSCYGGSFKSTRGDAPCSLCPTGTSTAAPYVAATAHAHCVCQGGYFRHVDAESSAAFCTPCPNGTFRTTNDVNDTTCSPCPPHTYTPGPGSAYCYCMPGTYLSAVFDACVPCEGGFYCLGDVRVACPPNSFSLEGSQARGDCVCDPSMYGDLSVSDACALRPPGFTYDYGGVCAPGWTPLVDAKTSRVRCVSPCSAGQYAHVNRSQALQGCVQCPPNSYASDGSLVDACTPCPLDRGTAGRHGATSADNCTCLRQPLSNQSSSCAGCPAGTYLDALSTHSCKPCPAKRTSPPGAVGAGACLCPRGTFASGAEDCLPCPKGTYSHALGRVCTPCPKGTSTDAVGQTTLAACRRGFI